MDPHEIEQELDGLEERSDEERAQALEELEARLRRALEEPPAPA